MSNLPKVDKPLFELTIPSTKTVTKFRPFVVREEKILLIAQQSGQEKDILLAIKQVLNNCAADAKFDVNKLATFDLEYLFLKLRAKSVNNMIEVSYRDTEDDKIYSFKIDLDEVNMLDEKNTNNKIVVNDTVGIVMKYPSVDILGNAPVEAGPTELVEYMVRSCIDSVYDTDNVYPAADYTTEELTEFIDSLDIDTFNRIRDFFDNLPQMYYKLEYVNTMGNAQKIEMTTLSDFFTWG